MSCDDSTAKAKAEDQRIDDRKERAIYLYYTTNANKTQFKSYAELLAFKKGKLTNC